MGRWREFKSVLRNLWVFRKTLLHHRPWDYQGTLQALRDALWDMQLYHKEHGHTVDADKLAEEMRVLCLILDRVMEGNYDLNYFDYKIIFDEGSMTVDAEKLRDLPTLELTRLQDRQHQELELVMKRLAKRLLSYWD